MIVSRKLNNSQHGDKNMKKILAFILKYLPFLDFNKDGKLNTVDADTAKAKVDATVADVKARVKAVKIEAADVVAAAKGKKRTGPKAK